MRKTLMQLATLGALGALLAVAPQVASAADDYELQGRWFGGTDIGVMQPLNALNRYVTTGGVLAPFVGYKFFDDKDLQLNIGLVGQMQFIGAGADPCNGCVRGVGVNNGGVSPSGDDNTMLALGFHAGPRVSLPYGPLEFYGMAQGGVLTGIAPEAPSAISDTSPGFLAGGGLNYALTDTFSLGLFANWNRWYQRVHHVGDVRYVNTGIQVMLQQPQEAPPAPVAQVPPPPPPPAPPMKKKIVLRGVNFDFDKYNIRPDAVPILEQACKTLKEEPSIDVSCDGYTDAIGSVAYNQKLSERRANAVRNWLVKCGVPASRLSARGFGKSNPVATNDTAEGRAQNRRTELVVGP